MVGVLPSAKPWMRALVVLAVVCATWSEPPAASAADRDATAAVTGREDRLKALEEEKKLIRLFADTLEQVRSQYVEADVSDRELIEAAIQGMMSKLDPYSNYIAPQDFDRFRKGVEREFVGIGIQVAERDGNLQITSPLFDTPAWRAGLRAGDKILKIDDTTTRGLSIDQAIKLMSGKVGTEVSVTILHADGKKAETVKMKREVIQQPTVIGYHRNSDGVWDFFCDEDKRIAYLRITAFSGNTAQDLRRILESLLDQGMQGLVVDLRFNPGGMLKQAILVSDLFLHEGRIVSIEGRSTPREAWDAKEKGTLVPKGFPVAVLINRFSASAAEIVSACLQDNKAATIVGERTWGKGSVQKIFELEEGHSALKLTTAGYHRPSGQNIHREVGASDEDQWGVHPDDGFAVKSTDRDIGILGVLFAQRDELTRVPTRAAIEDPNAEEANTEDSAVEDSVTEQPATEKAGDEKPVESPSAATPSEREAKLIDRQLEKALTALRTQIKGEGSDSQPATAKSQPSLPAEVQTAEQDAAPQQVPGANEVMPDSAEPPAEDTPKAKSPAEGVDQPKSPIKNRPPKNRPPESRPPESRPTVPAVSL